MLIFGKIVRKKPEVILTYEPSTDVLQRLNLDKFHDNKNSFIILSLKSRERSRYWCFLPEQLLVTTSVYETGE